MTLVTHSIYPVRASGDAGSELKPQKAQTRAMIASKLSYARLAPSSAGVAERSQGDLYNQIPVYRAKWKLICLAMKVCPAKSLA